jgi:hypothetical protein
VIEEINRGNPAQIFGELLTLMEDSKRDKSDAMRLAYPRSATERVYVPKNLYVIGTMNVADRSLALVDLALGASPSSISSRVSMIGGRSACRTITALTSTSSSKYATGSKCSISRLRGMIGLGRSSESVTPT